MNSSQNSIREKQILHKILYEKNRLFTNLIVFVLHLSKGVTPCPPPFYFRSHKCASPFLRSEKKPCPSLKVKSKPFPFSHHQQDEKLTFLLKIVKCY